MHLPNRRCRLKNIGFTYIELIIVIAIIGFLSTFFLFTYPGVQKNSRDSKRLNDLKQYQTALEVYANSHGGYYPRRTSIVLTSVELCTDLGLTDCPIDIRSGRFVCGSIGNIPQICNYYYQSNGTCAYGSPCASQFVLFTRLEKESNSFVHCSGGVSGKVNLST